MENVRRRRAEGLDLRRDDLVGDVLVRGPARVREVGHEVVDPPRRVEREGRLVRAPRDPVGRGRALRRHRAARRDLDASRRRVEHRAGLGVPPREAVFFFRLLFKGISRARVFQKIPSSMK